MFDNLTIQEIRAMISNTAPIPSEIRLGTEGIFEHFPASTQMFDNAVSKPDIALENVKTKLSQVKDKSDNFAAQFSVLTSVVGEVIDVPSVPGYLYTPGYKDWATHDFSQFPRIMKIMDADDEDQSTLMKEWVLNFASYINKYGILENDRTVLTITNQIGLIKLTVEDYSTDDHLCIVITNLMGNGYDTLFAAISDSGVVLNKLLQTYVTEGDPYTRIGESVSISAIANAFSVNTLFYDCITEMVSAAKSESSAAFSMVVSKFKEFPELTDLIDSARSSYIASGARGILYTIQDFFNSAKQVSINDDGRIDFLPTAKYAPVDFLSGISSLLITSISAIVDVIAFAINPIIGVIVTAITVIVSSLVTFFQQKVRTKSQYVDGNFPVYPVHGYAADQFVSLPSYNMGEPGYMLYNMDTPLVINGIGFKMVLSQWRTILRCETFVDYVNRLELLKTAHLFVRENVDENHYKVSFLVPNDEQLKDYSESFTPLSLGSDIPDDVDAELRMSIVYNIILSHLEMCNYYPNIYRGFGVTYFNNNDEPYEINDLRITNLSSGSVLLANFAKALYLYARGRNIIDVANMYCSWVHIYNFFDLVSKNGGLYVGDIDNNQFYFSFGPRVSEDYITNALRGSGFLLESRTLINPLGNDVLVPTLVPANADPAKLITQGVAIGLASIAIATTTIVVGLKIRKKINYIKARNMANVESAYDKFFHDPSLGNYEQYRLAVRKNNRFASIFGGTKFSKINRWDELSDIAKESPGTKISNLKDTFFPVSKEVNSNDRVSLAGILTAIIGSTH